MPVRSLNSPVLVWPGKNEVEKALKDWSARQAALQPGLMRLGYFGSYARGDWGVGSDLDLVAVMRASDTPFERRGAAWDLTGLPVPAEILVYTAGEWEGMIAEKGRFAEMLAREVIWVLGPQLFQYRRARIG